MRSGVATTVALREDLRRQLLALAGPGRPLQGCAHCASVANFLFLDLGRPNAPVAEALLRTGRDRQTGRSPDSSISCACP
jgi:histidinol-phosphate aminotransferase